MADALCGPSNPLQTFQKQTSGDRTLQQDRIASNRQFEQVFLIPADHLSLTADQIQGLSVLSWSKRRSSRCGVRSI